MAFLILTRAGFDSLVAGIGRVPDNVWITQDILSKEELDSYRAAGANITNFTYPVPLDDRAAINDALDTIAEHHPNEPVYAEWTDC
jgi:hypothetical protein